MKQTISLMLFACFFGALSVSSARADVIGTGNFTIFNIVGGPYAGDTFTGTFTFDATLAAFSAVPLLSFGTDFPSWAGGSLAVTTNCFDPAAGCAGVWYFQFFYAPAPVGNPNAFGLFANSCCGQGFFGYGTTFEVGESFDTVGDGVFTLAISSSPTPEPGSVVLLGIGLIGVTGAFLRKKAPYITLFDLRISQ